MNISKLLFRKWCNKYWRSLCCNMRWSIKEHLQTPSVSIYTETDALYIHIQVSPPTLEFSCPVPPWPMPELQNCRNIAYYLARCGKRITGNPTITKYLYPSAQCLMTQTSRNLSTFNFASLMPFFRLITPFLYFYRWFLRQNDVYMQKIPLFIKLKFSAELCRGPGPAGCRTATRRQGHTHTPATTITGDYVAK